MKKVKFGSYWQNNAEKEHLKWLVLDEKDGKTLLLSKYALDCKPFNQSCCNITWENCDLRKWLNSEFINNAFSKEEQQAIVITKNKTDFNIKTEDKIFLLSTEEALEYLPKKERKCRPTPYAKQHNAWSSNDNFCLWWLRSLGDDKSSVSYVNDGGDVRNRGYYVYNALIAIRVAMWADSSILLEYKDINECKLN